MVRMNTPKLVFASAANRGNKKAFDLVMVSRFQIRHIQAGGWMKR
jgi:hypothetical protein